MLKVVFDTDSLEPIKHISSHNNEYYQLPFSIGGYEVLFVKRQEFSEETEYSLGYLDENLLFRAEYVFDGDRAGNVVLENTSYNR